MPDKRRNHEAGIALVLALLSLMLLTFLGLALAATTSTELQIANNYRWSQQAFYNAEAGIEVAKKVLGEVSWNDVLPSQRLTGTVPTTWFGFEGTGGDTGPLDPAGSITTGSRDYENYACDWIGHGMGYGKVLNDGSNTFANVSSGTTAFSQTLHGAFTIWVRRKIVPATDVTGALTGQYQDAAGQTGIVITAEGVAPYTGPASDDAPALALSQQYQAVRTLEAEFSSQTVVTLCETPGGQTGGSEGSNVGKCYPLDPTSLCALLGNCTTDAAGNLVAPTQIGSSEAGYR